MSLKALLVLLLFSAVLPCSHAAENSAPAGVSRSVIRIATFDVDATPPIGSWLAYDPAINTWDLGLRARGIVLLGAGKPIVLCAVDWIGIANESHDIFCQTLATAAGTLPERVAVHTLHQHDAPVSDFSAERILKEARLDPREFDGTFARDFLPRLAAAVRASLGQAKPAIEIGLGEAAVHEVASNRRIMGTDGKVRAVRYTAAKDPALRAEPEGVIDPIVSLVSFWSANQPIAVLSYYACHPQSYYRTGIPNPDFPGVARFFRQLTVPQALHVHFNGAGGNIGAGKYNDGAPENRRILAERLADGMRRAWESTRREPLHPDSVSWTVMPVALPPARHLSEDAINVRLNDQSRPPQFRKAAAADLAWLRRCASGRKIEIACLNIGRASILHMPGELFVEYQLQAKSERSDRFIAMAAYGDYGPGYIGTTIAYEQGGYETQPTASRVTPAVEEVLMAAIRKLLQAP